MCAACRSMHRPTALPTAAKCYKDQSTCAPMVRTVACSSWMVGSLLAAVAAGSRCPNCNLLRSGDATHVGQVRQLALSDDPSVATHNMTTMASRPAVWHIPAFLSADECEALIARSTAGLRPSLTAENVESKVRFVPFGDVAGELGFDAAGSFFTLAEVLLVFTYMLDLPGLHHTHAGRIARAVDPASGGERIRRSVWEADSAHWPARVAKLAAGMVAEAREIAIRFSEHAWVRPPQPKP